MAEPDKCAVYPILYLDALVVKVRHDGRVINKAIHLALGVNLSRTLKSLSNERS